MSVWGGFDISEQREGLCYYVTVSGGLQWPFTVLPLAPRWGMSVWVRGGGGADPDSSCLKLTLTDPSWCPLTWAATTKNRKNRNLKRWTFYNFFLGIFIFGFQYNIYTIYAGQSRGAKVIIINCFNMAKADKCNLSWLSLSDNLHIMSKLLFEEEQGQDVL